MSDALRIAIATGGRFHALDLARELAKLGHEVAFYSFVPKSRVVRFGLPGSCHRGLLARIWPFLGFRRLSPSKQLKCYFEYHLTLALDRLVAQAVEPCDVFIGMSGLYFEAGLAARRKHGAMYILERGSRHILSQKEILDSMPGLLSNESVVFDFQVERELAGYAAADVISVPSRQVEASFVERGAYGAKLFRNSYGVDLSMFQPTQAPDPSLPPTIIYVGAWTWQKGVDLLVQAWRLLGKVRLVHVGARGDQPMPHDPFFSHVDPVPQWKLVDYYRQAHVFAIASRQEGLALVQAQALACGLPVVCTDRTGGEDLGELIPNRDLVTVVPHDNVQAMAAGLQKALATGVSMKGLRDGLGHAREAFSWEAYGKRYSEFLTSQRKTPARPGSKSIRVR